MYNKCLFHNPYILMENYRFTQNRQNYKQTTPLLHPAQVNDFLRNKKHFPATTYLFVVLYCFGMYIDFVNHHFVL